MARILVTGSADGLGRAAARSLLENGHDVVLHARSTERASVLSDLVDPASIVIGDLSSAVETRGIAEQVNDRGPLDAVIHNAGVYLQSGRGTTPEGHATTLAVNVLAPYLLTALIDRPARLVYLTSGMHRGSGDPLRDIDWTDRRWNASQAYSESKLLIVALAFAVARHWPEVRSNAVDPGWVPTRMGGPGAPDDLEMGHQTQTWLAASNDPGAEVTGGYWYHRKRQTPDPLAMDTDFQDRVLDRLAGFTGTRLV
jgi:NAD(P)-dependent dehydrogenase (short-subunit alcohol dehydrogenase family)